MADKMLRYVLREHERLNLGLKRLDLLLQMSASSDSNSDTPKRRQVFLPGKGHDMWSRLPQRGPN